MLIMNEYFVSLFTQMQEGNKSHPLFKLKIYAACIYMCLYKDTKINQKDKYVLFKHFVNTLSM